MIMYLVWFRAGYEYDNMPCVIHHRVPAVTPDFYYINDDCKVRPGGRVQQIWNTRRVHACEHARTTGLFFPAVGGCWTAGKNSPVAHRGGGGYTRSVFQICCTASYGDPARADKSLLSSAYK